MSVGWKLFRIICLLQMMAATFLTFTSFIFGSIGPMILQTIAFALIAAFSIFAFSLINTNYPDKPVVGKQKTRFNQLYLFNFLLLAFLFGHFFSAFRTLRDYASTLEVSIFDARWIVWRPVIVFSCMLLFQFILLYGMYILRRILYINSVTSRQFEFETPTERA